MGAWQCRCCDPARQIYWRAEGPRIDKPYHEITHTPADPSGEAPNGRAANKRLARRRRRRPAP